MTEIGGPKTTWNIQLAVPVVSPDADTVRGTLREVVSSTEIVEMCSFAWPRARDGGR
jgi:hypothetical protein